MSVSNKKYVILVGDGMGDYPHSSLGDRTPLMAANTPHMDFIANCGILGLVRTVPNGLPPGSDVANLSLLGYDPRLYHTGRGPIEAASLGIKAVPSDLIFRCNLVTLEKKGKSIYMKDYSAGHITSQEARELIYELNKHLGKEGFSFYPGVSYRHILIWHKTETDLNTIPPHDVSGQEISAYLESLPPSLQRLAELAEKYLANHAINRERIKKGLSPANAIWPWGQGRMLKMPFFKEKYGLKGAIISAVDLIKGIGVLSGLEVINVPGATGYFDTDYEAKAKYAIKALQTVDFVYVHVEAPDEASHLGNLNQKIKAIEEFDEKVVGNILRTIDKEDMKIMVTTDHYTPISKKTHSKEPVPFAIYDLPARASQWQAGKKEKRQKRKMFCEIFASKSGVFIDPGYKLMDFFFGDDYEQA